MAEIIDLFPDQWMPLSDDNEDSGISPETVLSKAIENELDTVIVIGTKEGEHYVAGSTASLQRLIFLLERAKVWLLTNELEHNR